MHFFPVGWAEKPYFSLSSIRLCGREETCSPETSFPVATHIFSYKLKKCSTTINDAPRYQYQEEKQPGSVGTCEKVPNRRCAPSPANFSDMHILLLLLAPTARAIRQFLKDMRLGRTQPQVAFSTQLTTARSTIECSSPARRRTA